MSDAMSDDSDDSILASIRNHQNLNQVQRNIIRAFALNLMESKEMIHTAFL